jgi:Mn-containing catalase
MFFRARHLQCNAKPQAPGPVHAKKLQEILGGQWGEISVMMSYLFQGWNRRAPAKHRDMILDIGTEETAHVAMIATMIARLLERSPVEAQEGAAKNSLVGTIMGGGRIENVILAGMNPQHAIVSGGGATPTDSVGYPWISRCTIASGNLLADFRFWNCSEGEESGEGSWAAGPTPDGRGRFTYLAQPKPLGPVPELGEADLRLHGTPSRPIKATT